MGRKKRGSNKMGSSANLQNAVSDDDDATVGEEGIYDEVDAWESQGDRKLVEAVKRTAAAGGRRPRDGGKQQQEVFALSGTDSDSDFDVAKMDKMVKKKNKKKKSAKQDEVVEDDDDFAGSEPEADEEERTKSWGTKKKHFYGGNTGEQYGEEEEDSDFNEDEAEEREAALLQERQLDRVDEEDFMDVFTLAEKKPVPAKEAGDTGEEESVKRDLSKLSNKQLAALFKQTSPEFDGIILDFKEKMRSAVSLSRVVSLEDQGKIPPGPLAEYIRSKFHLLLSYCLNITCYLMFKSKGTNLKLHPVTNRLVQYKQLIDSLGEQDSIVAPQVDSLLTRLDKGEGIDKIVREEKRREKKKMEKSAEKNKRLKLLRAGNGKKVTIEEPEAGGKKGKKEKKRKLDTMETLTGDERMAVELYQAIKRNKTDMSEDDDEEEDDQLSDVDTGMAGKENAGTNTVANLAGNTYNDGVPLADDAEEEKRAITYQIAKNKGLMPKRSKLQRNPRVKNRVKFEKAKKRRKGAVREVRTETTRYGGEFSGINARVKKGVKIK